MAWHIELDDSMVASLGRKLGCHAPKRSWTQRQIILLSRIYMTQWIEERCETSSRIGDTSSNLFSSWRTYAHSRGEEPNTAKWFTGSLERQGYRRDRDCELFRGRGFRGIRALSEPAAKHWQDSED